MSDKALQAIQDVVRIPFYQYENTSRGSSNDTYFDQMVINLIPEKMEDFDTQTMKQQLVKRPGIWSSGSLEWTSGIVADVTACTIRDFIQITALYDVCVAAVFDSSNNKFYIIQIRPETGTSAIIGTGISGNSTDSIYLSEISQSSGGNLVPGLAVNIVNSGLTASTGYYAVTSAGVFTGVLTTISSTSYPANQTPALIPVGRFVNMRGTFYIATLDGRIWNSYAGQNDISAWSNATSQIGSIRTDMYPDQCLGLARYKNNLVAFSRNSIEFFNEVGPSVNNPSTLQTIDQAFIKFGALKPDLIRNVDDDLYWVAYGSDGQTGLWVLEGYRPVKVSTPFIDSQIAATASSLNTYAFNLQSCVMNGKRQVFINSIICHSMLYLTDTSLFDSSDTYDVVINDGRPTAAVYNADDRTWWGFAWMQNGNATIRFATAFASPSQGKLYKQYALVDTLSESASYIYSITVDTYKDGVSGSDGPVGAYAQLNPQWFGNSKRKRISKLKVINNTVPVKGGSDTNTYHMYLVYTKDNLATTTGGFFNTMVRKMDHPPAQGRYVLNNLGMGRVWNLAIVEKSIMGLRLNSLELDIQQGSH